MNNRRSGDFGYNLSSDDVSDTTADTLDPALIVGGIQQNLRKLLRTKHRLNTESITEDDKESDWGTWGRAGGDQAQAEKRSSNSFQIIARYIHE